MREVLLDLVRYEFSLKQVRQYESYIQRSEELRKAEAANYEERLKLAEERVQLAERKAAIEKERGDFYQISYEKLLKIQKGGCGFWGTVKRIFTAGIASCH